MGDPRKPPGSRLPPAAKKEFDAVSRAKALIASPESDEKRREKEDARKSVHHLNSRYRDGHKVLRGSGIDVKTGKRYGGRFAKDPTPPHNPPKRIPWDKPGRNELRRQRKSSKKLPKTKMSPAIE